MQIKRKLDNVTADKRKLQQKTAKMKRSWDEVSKILDSSKVGKKSK